MDAPKVVETPVVQEKVVDALVQGFEVSASSAQVEGEVIAEKVTEQPKETEVPEVETSTPAKEPTPEKTPTIPKDPKESAVTNSTKYSRR